jgi:flavin-dependent dehydrogenase
MIVKENVLLAGDAAGFADPFTGEGIFYALKSGLLAARTVIKHLDEDEALAGYQHSVEAELLPLLSASLRLATPFYRLPGFVKGFIAFLRHRRLPDLAHL